MSSRVQTVQAALKSGLVRKKATTINIRNTSGAKANQAWKYADCKIVRAPSLILGGKEYFDPISSTATTKVPRREQESNFWITINTNKAPSLADMPNAVRCMEECLDALASDTVLPRYLTFGPRNTEFKADVARDVVTGIDWKASVEIGDHQHRLHAHIELRIKHYSQLQINRDAMGKFARRAWNRCIGDSPPYLHASRKFYVHVKLEAQQDWQGIKARYQAKALCP